MTLPSPSPPCGQYQYHPSSPVPLYPFHPLSSSVIHPPLPLPSPPPPSSIHLYLCHPLSPFLPQSCTRFCIDTSAPLPRRRHGVSKPDLATQQGASRRSNIRAIYGASVAADLHDLETSSGDVDAFDSAAMPSELCLRATGLVSGEWDGIRVCYLFVCGQIRYTRRGLFVGRGARGLRGRFVGRCARGLRGR